MDEKVNNIIVISDLHCGCRLGLHPPGELILDLGMRSFPSRLQLKLWSIWHEFCNEWVPNVTKGEPFDLVVNGDSTDGAHHGSVTQISQNIIDQKRIALAILEPLVEKCRNLYVIRGTEVHVGKSGTQEESLAENLEAIPDEEGQFSRYELWYRLGDRLIHFLHHIGTTGRTHYETSAVMAELGEMFTDSGRWRYDPPDAVVRSHRHRFVEVRVPTSKGYGIAFTTPGWQLKTPFAFKIAGARITTPQIGGSLIRLGDQDLYTRHFVKSIQRSREVCNA